jgi:hypothetical protein
MHTDKLHREIIPLYASCLFLNFVVLFNVNLEPSKTRLTC